MAGAVIDLSPRQTALFDKGDDSGIRTATIVDRRTGEIEYSGTTAPGETPNDFATRHLQRGPRDFYGRK